MRDDINDLKRMLTKHSEVVEQAKNEFMIRAEILRAHYLALIQAGFTANESLYLTNEYAHACRTAK
jgi:hypothetical protein